MIWRKVLIEKKSKDINFGPDLAEYSIPFICYYILSWPVILAEIVEITL